MKTMLLMVIFSEQSGQSEGRVPADGLQVPLQRAEQGCQQQDHSQAPQDTQDLERFSENIWHSEVTSVIFD